MCARVGENFCLCQVGATLLLTQEADLGVFSGLCKESDASISKEMRPPAIEAVPSTAQCTTYIFLCSVDFVRRLEESCINNYYKCPD